MNTFNPNNPYNYIGQHHNILVEDSVTKEYSEDYENRKNQVMSNIISEMEQMNFDIQQIDLSIPVYADNPNPTFENVNFLEDYEVIINEVSTLNNDEKNYVIDYLNQIVALQGESDFSVIISEMITIENNLINNKPANVAEEVISLFAIGRYSSEFNFGGNDRPEAISIFRKIGNWVEERWERIVGDVVGGVIGGVVTGPLWPLGALQGAAAGSTIVAMLE